MSRVSFGFVAGMFLVSCGGSVDRRSPPEPPESSGGMTSGGERSVGGTPAVAGAGGNVNTGSPEGCLAISASISAEQLAERAASELGVALDPAQLELPGDSPKVRGRRLTDAIDESVRESGLPASMSQTLGDFVTDRLLGETDPSRQERRLRAYPEEIASDLGADMDAEFARALDHWLTAGTSTLEHLLTDNTAFVSPVLARHYGVPIPDGEGFVPVSLQKETQMGLLTRGAFLARLPSPPDRALHLVQALTCSVPIPEPPVMESVWDAPDRPPAKQVVALGYGENQATCATCHVAYIGYGIALDRYDELGRYREKQGDVTIDTSSRLAVPSLPSPLEFTGPEQLGRDLSRTRGVHQCFVESLVQRLGLEALDEGELSCVTNEFATRGARLDALLTLLAPRWIARE